MASYLILTLNLLRRYWIFIPGLFTFTLLMVAYSEVGPNPTTDVDFHWRSDWAIRRGYTINIDTQGYELPITIAFVPSPGDDPKDPLYFVTELKGKVKVVTNDRSVYTFAENFFELGPVAAYGATNSLEIGLAGICLEPKRGYVFVTFAYHDFEGTLRNNIVRFQSESRKFSLAPESQVEFGDMLISDQSNASHQIGSCQVNDDLLYVSIGDGEQPDQSQQLDSTLGKVLRTTLNGEPVEENPCYEDSDHENAANYIWAYGFRNPFGLTIADGRVFIADNGPSIDRFLEAKAGENYLWDGSDKSIGVKAIAVLSPGKGLSHLDYHSGIHSGFPHGFFLYLSGVPGELDSEIPPQVLNIQYDLEEDKLLSVPEPFLRYVGIDPQVLAGVRLGSDGLYFVPLLPNQAARLAGLP